MRSALPDVVPVLQVLDEPRMRGSQIDSYGSTSYWVQRMFARNVGDRVLPVTASAAGLYYSATVDRRTGRAYLKIVNPGAQSVPSQLTFGGRQTSVAAIEVLTSPDPQSGNTLTDPNAVVPSRARLNGSRGAFSYEVPANSLTVVTVAGR